MYIHCGTLLELAHLELPGLAFGSLGLSLIPSVINSAPHLSLTSLEEATVFLFKAKLTLSDLFNSEARTDNPLTETILAAIPQAINLFILSLFFNKIPPPNFHTILSTIFIQYIKYI